MSNLHIGGGNTCSPIPPLLLLSSSSITIGTDLWNANKITTIKEHLQNKISKKWHKGKEQRERRRKGNVRAFNVRRKEGQRGRHRKINQHHYDMQ